MLTDIYIKNIVLMEKAHFSIGDGLTALTGETGAGKSVLLDSLALATGGKAEKGLVRHGATQGVVSASFMPTPQHPVWHLLAQNDIDAKTEEELILRRVQETNGRSKAYINDQPVSVGLLRQIGEALIEVHGQFAGQGFMDSAQHIHLLDEFAGHQKLVDKLKCAFAEWQEIAKKIEAKKLARDHALREADYLTHVVSELAELNPQIGEEEELALMRTEYMAAEKVADDLAKLDEILLQNDLEQKLASVMGRLESLSHQHQASEKGSMLGQVVSRLDQMLNEMSEAQLYVHDSLSAFDVDLSALNQCEERLFALRAAARKYHTNADGLGAFYQKCQADLQLIEQGESDLEALELACKEASTRYFDLAAKISANREKAAKKLERAMKQELAPLKLEKAKFIVSINQEKRLHPLGCDHVSFLVATNPGVAPGPLKQIASGGELSRFILAMKAALMAKENKTVIIFDEVDAGIGGAVADAVGERLTALAERAQVMVITHSPQVAARADEHWLVEKAGCKKVTTSLMKLDKVARQEEIARMLSGAEVTREARAAADKLLAA